MSAPSCHLSAQNSFFLSVKLSEAMSLSIVSGIDTFPENHVIIKKYCISLLLQQNDYNPSGSENCMKIYLSWSRDVVPVR